MIRGGRAGRRGGHGQGNQHGRGRDGALFVVNAAPGRAGRLGPRLNGCWGGRARGPGNIKIPAAHQGVANGFHPFPLDQDVPFPLAAPDHDHGAIQEHPPILPKCLVCDQLLQPTPVDLNITSAHQMLQFGLGLMRFETIAAYGVLTLTRFHAHYGIDPAGIFAMFNNLKEAGAQTDPCCLLMAMNFLKSYETEPCMASRWRLQEATIRLKVRDYIRRIQEPKEQKVSLIMSLAFLVRL
jgi:hypothetical protein